MKYKKPLAAFLSSFMAAAMAAELPPTAQELGLMQGFPVAVENEVNRGNFMQPPFNRWSLQHIRELQPTREIYRGSGAVSPLQQGQPISSTHSVTKTNGETLALENWLREAYTDAVLVMHRGEIVYEQYFGGMQPHTQHQMFSATKSWIGTLILVLAEQGLVDTGKKVSHYLPFLNKGAFADATVQQVLDMTNAIAYSEEYDNPESDIWKYGHVFGVFGELPKGYSGPLSIYQYLPTLQKKGEHGYGFHYVTPNTDVLGLIAQKVTGKRLATLFAEIFWQPMGFERDGYFWLDRKGNEMAGGGLNISLRDAARFGQMILQGGKFNGRQIIPAQVAKRILQPGNPDTFARYYKDPWYQEIGFAYHDQWWTFDNSHKAVSALGVHGQAIYLDPVAEMVIVKQSSDPEAEGERNEVDGPFIYQQLAEYLLKRQAGVSERTAAR